MGFARGERALHDASIQNTRSSANLQIVSSVSCVSWVSDYGENTDWNCPTNGPLFAALVVGVIVIVGALTFFPVLSLSPIVEHFIVPTGKVF